MENREYERGLQERDRRIEDLENALKDRADQVNHYISTISDLQLRVVNNDRTVDQEDKGVQLSQSMGMAGSSSQQSRLSIRGGNRVAAGRSMSDFAVGDQDLSRGQRDLCGENYPEMAGSQSQRGAGGAMPPPRPPRPSTGMAVAVAGCQSTIPASLTSLGALGDPSTMVPGLVVDTQLQATLGSVQNRIQAYVHRCKSRMLEDLDGLAQAMSLGFSEMQSVDSTRLAHHTIERQTLSALLERQRQDNAKLLENLNLAIAHSPGQGNPAARQDCAKLQAQVQQLEQQLAEAQEAVARSGAVQAQLEEARSRVQELEAHLSAQGTSNAAELIEARTRNQELRSELKVQLEKVAAVEAQLAEARTRAEQKDKELEEATEARTDASRRLQSLERSLADSSRKATESKKLVDKTRVLEARVAELSDTLAARETERAKLKQDLRATEAKVVDLSETLASRDAERTKLRQEFRSAEARIEELGKQLKAEQSQAHTLSLKFEALQKQQQQNGEERSSMRQNLHAAQERQGTAERQAEEARAQAQQLQTHLAETEGQLKQVREQLTHAQEELTRTREQLTQAREQAASAERQAKFTVMRMASLEGEAESQREKLLQLQAQLEGKQAELQRLEAARDSGHFPTPSAPSLPPLPTLPPL
eukprot:RCo051041